MPTDPLQARATTWAPGRTMTLCIASRAELRFETHWLGGRTRVCPRKGCPLCKYELPCARIGVFGQEVTRTNDIDELLRWINLPEEPWSYADPLPSLSDLRGAVVTCTRHGKTINVTPLGRRHELARLNDVPLAASIRLVAKMHRLAIDPELTGIDSLHKSLLAAADRQLRHLVG